MDEGFRLLAQKVPALTNKEFLNLLRVAVDEGNIEIFRARHPLEAPRRFRSTCEEGLATCDHLVV